VYRIFGLLVLRGYRLVLVDPTAINNKYALGSQPINRWCLSLLFVKCEQGRNNKPLPMNGRRPQSDEPVGCCCSLLPAPFPPRAKFASLSLVGELSLKRLVGGNREQ